MHVAFFQNMIRIGPHAQVVDVIGNIHPAVWNAIGDDHNIARRHFAFGHVAHNLAALGWPVQHFGRLAFGSRACPVDDCASGDHRSAARNDDVCLGFIVVRDASSPAGRRIGWRRAAALALHMGCFVFPFDGFSCSTAGFAAGPAMDNSHPQVVLA